MKRIAVIVLAAALATPVWAQQTQQHSGHHPAPLADGEVRKVDKDAQKITIKHGAIENLDMPAHTMVFRVKDPAMLERVKAGDKVKFQAEKAGGAFLLTSIKKVQ